MIKRRNKSQDKPLKVKKTFGFTLVELVVAIGVLGVLASGLIFIINPIAQIEKARDSQRKSDLAQIQRALEQYYNDFGKYPDGTVYQDSSCSTCIVGEDGFVNWGLPWSPYMDRLPKDPESGQYYRYITKGQMYYIYTHLERGMQNPQACQDPRGCTIDIPGLPPGAFLRSNSLPCGPTGAGYCNYGVSSPNTSP